MLMLLRMNALRRKSNEEQLQLQNYTNEDMALKHAKTFQRTTHASLCYSILLEVLLVMVVTSITVITWFFASKHVEHSVSIVSDAFRGELLAHVKAHTTSVLEGNNDSAIHLSQLMASYAIKTNLSSYSALENWVKPVLFQGYSTIPYTTQIFYMGNNGLFVSYYSDFDKTLILYANTTYTNNNFRHLGNAISYSQKYLWYRQSASANTGLPTGDAIATRAVDFWSTEWFINGFHSKNGLSSWGLSFGQPKELLFMSLAAIKDASSADPFGVLSLGVPSRVLMESIRLLDLLGGDMYLSTKDGYLLAQTRLELHVGGEPDKPILLEAMESNNLVIAGAALYLKNKLKNISILGSEISRSSDVRIQGTEYIIDTTPIHVAGTTMVCVVVIPQRSIWGSLKKQDRTTLILLISLAVCMFLISCVFVFLLTRAASKEMHLCAALIQQLEATKQAERKVKEKSIIFASMSHDLRTSLAAIIGLIDLCHGDAAEGSELETNLWQMNSCASNLLGILNSILDVSKIEAGKLQLEEVDFNMVQVLEEVVDMFSVVAVKKGVEVVLDLCDESVEKMSWVNGDAGRLKQILSNLLSNGVKFTSEGHVILRAWAKQIALRKPAIHECSNKQCFIAFWKYMFKCFVMDNELCRQLVSCSEGHNDPDHVEFEFEVEDTGKGIPQDRRKAVFENFVQVDKLTSRNYGGTGLGLGIVQSLVHLMGGDISIVEKGEPGESGTCFRFNIFFKSTEISARASKNERYQSSDTKGIDGDSIHSAIDSSCTYGIQDWQLGIKSHSFTSNISKACYQTSPPVEHVYAVLAMHGDASKRILKKWMQCRGIQVLMVNQWADFIPTLENLKQEVMLQSFRSSEMSELVSPASHLSDPWADELDLGAYQSDRFLDYGVKQPHLASYDPILGDSKQTTLNGIGAYLLLLVDMDMIVGPPEQVSMILRRFSGIIQRSNYKVVWLTTANIPNVDFEILRKGMVPCDLILHKPVHGSRLHAIWELVQDLTGKRMFHAAEIESPDVFKQIQTSNQHCKRRSFHQSTFSLTNLQDPSQVRLASTPKDKTLTSRKLEGMHILVAEDNIVLQRLAQTMLTRLGATVECVDNGAEAVRVVSESLQRHVNNQNFYSSRDWPFAVSDSTRACLFDILLMDCEMPVMDGYEATRKIREEEKRYGFHVPVVALTAHVMAEEERKCIQSGMDFHLAKPLAIEPLLNVIDRLCSDKIIMEF